MNRIVMALALSLACAPGVALAQDSDAPAPADTTPPPSADCTTLDCNTTRQQQDNLNNNSGTPGAQDSLGDDQGTTGGSGTLPPYGTVWAYSPTSRSTRCCALCVGGISIFLLFLLE